MEFCFRISRDTLELKFDDVQLFKEELRENYNVSEIELAEFIKKRKPNTKAFIITFSQEKLPYTLYIPGERSDTKVKPYNDRPMLCRQCQNYGHTDKRCKNTQTICRRCSAIVHTSQDCTSEEPNCTHCSENHPSCRRLKMLKMKK